LSEIFVRQATLADTYAITDLHCSTVEGGFFTRRHEDLTRTPTPYEELSLFERYQNRGAWMSAETCAVWLAYLLRYGDEIPLVAVADGLVLGEAEIAIGKEPSPYGHHLNISMLCVHTQAQRQGLGTALVNYVKQMAKVMKVYQILVADPMPSDFYVKQGFKPTLLRREVIIPSKAGRVFYKATELTSFDLNPKMIEGWSMPFGRYQNARHEWIRVLPGFWNGVPELVEPEVHRFEITFTGQRAVLVLEQDRYIPTRAHVYLWAERPLSTNLVSIVKDRAAQSGYEELCLFLDDAARALIEGEVIETREAKMLMAFRV
jgi:GNAT superfamily N-acetyltransferase